MEKNFKKASGAKNSNPVAKNAFAKLPFQIIEKIVNLGGCTHMCSYCYNDNGIMKGAVGGQNVRLKVSINGTNPFLAASLIAMVGIGVYTIKKFVDKANRKEGND